MSLILPAIYGQTTPRQLGKGILPSLAKPSLWTLDPRLVAPEWRWFYVGLSMCCPLTESGSNGIWLYTDGAPKWCPFTSGYEPQWVYTDRGVALRFDGAGGGNDIDFVETNHAVGYDTAYDDITFASYASFDGTDYGDSNIFTFGCNTKVNLSIDPTSGIGNIWNSADWVGGYARTDAWHLMAGRYKGTDGFDRSSLWFDGVEVGTPTTENLPTEGAETWRVGAYTSSTTNFGWNGDIAWVAFWRRALNETELRQLTDDPFGWMRPVAVPSWVPMLDVEAGVTLDQEGYRWRLDDNDEATATWLAAQDINITRQKSLNTRIRIIVNATGDPDSETYQIEYREKGSGDPWRKIE